MRVFNVTISTGPYVWYTDDVKEAFNFKDFLCRMGFQVMVAVDREGTQQVITYGKIIAP